MSTSEGFGKRILSGTSTSLRRLLPRSFYSKRKERRSLETAMASGLAESQLSPPLQKLSGSSVISQKKKDNSSFISRESYDSANEYPDVSFGFQRGFEEKYELLQELGRGGSGVVRYGISKLIEDWVLSFQQLLLVVHVHPFSFCVLLFSQAKNVCVIISCRVARCRATGTEFACKSLPKVLQDPSVSEAKRQGHVEAIKREIDVLRRLRGALNVASMQDVYEDDYKVHILMECCTGGELWHALGQRHYSERTVSCGHMHRQLDGTSML